MSNIKTKKTNKTVGKKQRSKLSQLLLRINPNTPAKKLLTFMLVFGVLGGGYFAYSSFAATSNLFTSYFVKVEGCRNSIDKNKVRFKVKNNTYTSASSPGTPLKSITIWRGFMAFPVDELKPGESKWTAYKNTDPEYYSYSIQAITKAGSSIDVGTFKTAPKHLPVCSSSKSS